jgi:hypothetical protein
MLPFNWYGNKGISQMLDTALVVHSCFAIHSQAQVLWQLSDSFFFLFLFLKRRVI